MLNNAIFHVDLLFRFVYLCVTTYMFLEIYGKYYNYYYNSLNTASNASFDASNYQSKGLNRLFDGTIQSNMKLPVRKVNRKLGARHSDRNIRGVSTSVG